MADNNRYRDEHRSSGHQGDQYNSQHQRDQRENEQSWGNTASGNEYMGYQGGNSRNIGQWNDQRGGGGRQDEGGWGAQAGQGGAQRVNYVPDHNERDHYSHGHHQEENWNRQRSGQDRAHEQHTGQNRGSGGQGGWNEQQQGNRQQRHYDETNSYNQGRDREHSRYEQSGWDPRFRNENEGRGEQYRSSNNLYREGRNTEDRYGNRDRDHHQGASRLGDHEGYRTRESSRDRHEEDRYSSRGENRGAFSGRGPKNYQRSKERIYEDVCDRLYIDDRLDASEIEVNVDENEVVLSGTVTSKEAKRRAEDLAESIPGVRNVENRIRVVAPEAGTTETMNTIIRNAGNMPDQRKDS